MTHHPEIWGCILENLVSGRWTSLNEIYDIVERNLTLDREDFKPQSPTSNGPKWKRNVRNVLHHRNKKTGDIDWNGQEMYRV